MRVRQVVSLLVYTTLAVSVLASLAPAEARAYEDQLTAGLSVGYAVMPGDDALPEHAFHFGLSGTLGLSDAWSLGAHMSYQVHPDDLPLHVWILGVEALYLVDLVRFVPFFGAGIDGLLSTRDSNLGGDFGLHAVVGFDFLINPRWLIGLDARPFWVPAELSDDLEPFYFTVAFRVGFRFDRR